MRLQGIAWGEAAERRRVAKFIFAGGMAALANVGSRFLFSYFMPYVAAITLAYLVGMVCGFTLMRQFVFERGAKPIAQQVIWYCVINVLALLQTILVSLFMARLVLPGMGIVAYAETIGHLCGVVVPIITSYVGHRLLTFR